MEAVIARIIPVIPFAFINGDQNLSHLVRIVIVSVLFSPSDTKQMISCVSSLI